MDKFRGNQPVSNRKMAYLTFNGRIPSRWADGVAVMNTCAGFGAQGWDVSLLLPRGQDTPRSELQLNGPVYDFYSVPDNFKISRIPALFNPFSKPGLVLYGLLAGYVSVRKSVEIVYAREVELAYFAYLLGKNVVFESHNINRNKKHPFFRFLVNAFKTRGTQLRMVATARVTADAYQQLGVPAESIIVESNGVSLSKFESLPSQEDLKGQLGLSKRPIICHIGNLYPGRGIEELLDAAKEINEPQFLFVGGIPSDVERCRSYASEKQITNARFIGHVAPDQVPSYIRASDILAMPYTSGTHSHKTMSPMKMFDYLGGGHPIVATDFPVVREVLVHKKNAFLVQPDSAQALAEGLRWVLQNPAEAQKLGKQALADANHYSWANRTRRISDWIKGQYNLS